MSAREASSVLTAPKPEPDLRFQALVAQSFGCGDELAGHVAGLARHHSYTPRATIVSPEIAEGGYVHLLAEGHARMAAYSLDGRAVVIEDYGVGDLFGDGGLFAPLQEGADICAVGQTATGAFANEAFLGLMTRHSTVALAVSRQLVNRLATMARRLMEGGTLTAAGRIHAEIKRRAGPSLVISPMPVFAEMALAVQSTRETVSRSINALERRGIVKRGEDCLIIVAPHRLDELIY